MLATTLRMVRRGRYDLIHAVEESAFMALFVRWMYKVPYIYDMDSGLARQMMDKFGFLRRLRRPLEGFEKAAVRGSVATLAVCKTLEDQARACWPEGLIARIEDISLLGGGGGDVDDVPEGPVAMYVGNLQRYQGIDLLLDSFRHALREVPAAKLVVIGGDEESLRLYKARAADLAESVRFLGPRPVEKLGAYLRRATVLVSPRIQGENTPMKVYSYLDSGRPVLATRLPTHTQVLTDDIARLADPEPEAKLVVIGGDEESLRRYKALAADLGESVRFLGPRPVERLGAYLRRATVLVSPRIHGENTPMKVYSYLDSGRPVLATRLPTHTQVLTDDIARLADPEPGAMGSALAELLRDAVLRERLARAARDFAQRELTREAFEGKLLRFYDSVEERIREERPDGQTARLQARHQGHR